MFACELLFPSDDRIHIELVSVTEQCVASNVSCWPTAQVMGSICVDGAGFEIYWILVQNVRGSMWQKRIN